MAEKKGFVIYFDWREQFELLPPEDRGKLLMALLDYGESGKMPDLHDSVSMAFSFMRAQMDRDATKYAERCAINAENGAKGGRPRKANKSENNREKPKETKRFLDKPRKPDTDTDTPVELRFDEFWNAYPKKVGKQYALKAWNKIKPTAELHETIMQAVDRQKRSDQWRRENGRYIPNPATWLNGGYWDNSEEVSMDAGDQRDPDRDPDAGRDWGRGFKPADDGWV